jgi:hypothetical protein
MEKLMKVMFKSISALVLSLSAAATFASPIFLITHNETDLESNAYVAGTIPSPYPTIPNSTRQIYWNMVRIACYGHSVNGKCIAVIKMATDTDHPIEIGTVSMDLDTGVISPSKISANGYTFTVNDIAEGTLTKD